MKKYVKIFILIFIFNNLTTFAQIKDEEKNNTEKLIFRRKADATSEENNKDYSETNIKSKEKIIEKMVKEAIGFFNQNSLEKSFNEFAHNLKWRNGEIFPFVFDTDGNVLVHGDDNNIIWKNLHKIKKDFSSDFNDILSVSHEGGWVQYKWNNSSKRSFVKLVEKDNLKYIIGAGFFPQSKKYDAETLVKEAVRRFYLEGRKETFSRINNPIGMFVRGDIYTLVYDFKGNILAYGENPALMGQNLIDLKDSNGEFIVRKMIKVAESKEGKGWVSYYWRNGFKRVYVERVTEFKSKKNYLIAAGYYPNTTFDAVTAFVSRAIRHLKDVGARQAFSDFSNPVGEYIRGGMSVFVYNMEGVCVANGENPELVNQNLIKLKDPEGKYITKSMLNIANSEGKGIFSYTYKNATKLVYVEKVDVPDGKFVIGSGYYPNSKPQTVRSLVNSGIYFLNNNSNIESFRLFEEPESEFFRGDIFLFVYTLKGIALVNGTQSNMIWQNYSKVIDEKGKALIDNLISVAKAGGGWITYNSRNAKRRVYVHLLKKHDKDGNKNEFFVIGSGYYL